MTRIVGLTLALAAVVATAALGFFQSLLKLSPGQEVILAILLIAAILWVSELVPLFVTGFVILLLELVWLMPAIEASGTPVTQSDFMSPFFSNIILLFMGGFVLSILLHKFGLDLRIARMILNRTRARPASMLMAIMLLSASLSMWMSNTATTAMMFAVMMPIISQVPEGNRFGKALALAIPFACNLGGMGTPIGSPPNAIAIGYLTKAGIDISFAAWMAMTLPVLLVLLYFLCQLLLRIYPAQGFLFTMEFTKARPLARTEKFVIAIFTVTCLAWLTTGYHGFATGTVSLVLLIVCFGSRILQQEDFRAMSWDVLFMIGGGLALGVGMEKSGLTEVIVGLLPSGAGPIVIPLSFVLLAGVMTTFISNSATANLIVPLAVSVGGESGVLVVCVALMCSSAMALPVSTPPNAIAFSSGILKSRDMILVGGLISLVGVGLIGFLLRPWLGVLGLP